MTLAQSIGQAVKKARKKNNITQKDLANETNISRNYLSDIECGRYIPSVGKLVTLFSKLNIDLNIIKNDGNTRSD